MTNEQERNAHPGGPAPELSMDSDRGKPAVMVCPDCGHPNIQGADFCENCQAPLRALDIPSDTWSPSVGPPGEAIGSMATMGNLYQVSPDTTVRRTVAGMREHEVGCAVVVDGGRVTGIFTERDLLYRVTPDRNAMLDKPVREVMTPDPVVMREGDSILVAVNKMAVDGFRHIPVVGANGEPKGMLSGRDILNALAPQMGGSA